MSINSQLDVAASLNAHENFRARDGLSFCNIYACAFLGMRGHVVPLNMTANGLYDWFSSPSALAAGWRRAGRDEALAAANAGGDAVAVAKHEPHGHIGICVASLLETPGRLCISAAGAENFIRAPIERSFGELSPTFFVNSG